MLNLNERVVELQIECVSLDRHRRKLLLDCNCLVQLLEELSLSGISLDLAKYLLKSLHLALNLRTDLLFLFFQCRVFGIVRLEQAFVLSENLFLCLILGLRSKQVFGSVS